MSKTKVFKNVRQLQRAWEKYKLDCDAQANPPDDPDSKSKQSKHAVTYTIQGFCVFSGISSSTFNNCYANDDRFSDMVLRMKEECESDTRKKLELGVIPASLAALWMSRYGYSTKSTPNFFGSVPVIISGDDTLDD